MTFDGVARDRQPEAEATAIGQTSCLVPFEEGGEHLLAQWGWNTWAIVGDIDLYSAAVSDAQPDLHGGAVLDRVVDYIGDRTRQNPRPACEDDVRRTLIGDSVPDIREFCADRLQDARQIDTGSALRLHVLAQVVQCLVKHARNPGDLVQGAVSEILIRYTFCP